MQLGGGNWRTCVYSMCLCMLACVRVRVCEGDGSGSWTCSSLNLQAIRSQKKKSLSRFSLSEFQASAKDVSDQLSVFALEIRHPSPSLCGSWSSPMAGQQHIASVYCTGSLGVCGLE